MRVRKHNAKGPEPSVVVDGEVLRQIRQHARSNSKTEICGVLIGSEDKNSLSIEACIAGANATQAGTHVTFTQDTWAHIYQTKDAKYPDHRIVGWYHSHPGFGVFLSDHDTFIHKNFFSSPLQVAWVYDPHSDEEGCFGWVGQRIERLSDIAVVDHKGGEGAGETGKPEPMGNFDEGAEEELAANKPDRDQETPRWLRTTFSLLSYILVLVLGFLASWIFFPHKEMYFIDPATGLVFEPTQDGKHLQPVPGLRVGPGFAAPGDLTSTPTPQGGSTPPATNPDASKEKNVPRQK